MQILTLSDLPARGIRLSRVTIWRLERDGLFPKRLQISPGRIGWLATEIDAFIEARAAEREAA